MTDTRERSQSSGNTGSNAGESASARSRVASAYETARERTSAAYGTARDGAASTARRAADGIDANPMAAVVGGLAIGAIAAAFIPRTRKEEELLGPIGGRIADTARGAVEAAKEAGREKLDEIGLNKDTARQRASDLIGGAASAAVESVRGKR
jgi:ElaB/YqjD/DUF883 family membrane-anchored ribosome-binding protein